MSFGSYDDIIAALVAGQKYTAIWQKTATTGGVSGLWYHLWPVGGYPVPGSYSGTNLRWTPTTETTTGALAHGGNVSPNEKFATYVSHFNEFGGPQTPIFIDMVGYYPLTESSSVQVFDNTTNGAPNRYCSAGQCGLQMMLVAAGTVSSGSSVTISGLTYVNQNGVAGRSVPASSIPGLRGGVTGPSTSFGASVLFNTTGMPFIPLASGDMGVRSATNITFNGTALSTGNVALVLCKPLFALSAAQFVQDRDLITQRASMERIYDGACISMVVNFMDNGPYLLGALDFVWG